MLGGVGYFAIGGPGDSIAGSNALSRVDPVYGCNQGGGNYAPTINGGISISGLAALVPEPAGVVRLRRVAAAAATSSSRLCPLSPRVVKPKRSRTALARGGQVLSGPFPAR